MNTEYAYKVLTFCEVNKTWVQVYRQGKGDLFNSISGCKQYIARVNKKFSPMGSPKKPYKIITYRLEIHGVETV